MDKNAIKKYAIWARRELIARVSQRAAMYEITAEGYGDADAVSVHGRILSQEEKNQRRALITKIKEKGYEQVMEEVAYTWFNRFSALRFMEVNGYLPSHVRVFTDDENNFKPQIMTEAINLEMDGLDIRKVFAFKTANDDDGLFKYLIITQCNALSDILPGMFEKISDYTELLFPDNLLREGSVVERLIAMIPEVNFNINSGEGQIEIIGWLYQYYISEKHEEVVNLFNGAVVNKEELPAATQLFTTRWIVKYLIDNSVGRYWIERNPNSQLADKLFYFVRPKNGKITTIHNDIIPQEITVFDPCVGSGHFLVYAFEVLMKIYEECGYTERDAAIEIVRSNLFGLDIDNRAIQLAYFAVMMKARQYDKRFFNRGIQPHVYEIIESNNIDRGSIEYFCGNDDILKKDIETILETFKDAKEYGSILKMPEVNLERISKRFEKLCNETSIYDTYLFNDFRLLIRSVEVMSSKYTVVATNPPYLNKYDNKLKEYITKYYTEYKGDLFSVFIFRNFDFCKTAGFSGLMTPMVWLFIKTYEKLRKFVIENKHLLSLIQLEYSAYEEATVPICAFILQNVKGNSKSLCIRLSEFTGGMEVQKKKALEAINNPNCDYLYEANENDFLKIPGYPIDYWLSDKFISLLSQKETIGSQYKSGSGLSTADNERFLRFFWEVERNKIASNKNDKKKWFLFHKGGEFRKWFGNLYYVVNWENDGEEIKYWVTHNPKDPNTTHWSRRIFNTDLYFLYGVTWSVISSGEISFRAIDPNAMISNAAGGIFGFKSIEERDSFMAAVNTTIWTKLFATINPTLNYSSGVIQKAPCPSLIITDLGKKCIDLAKKDWDSFETSWDFQTHPLVSYRTSLGTSLIQNSYQEWENDTNERFSLLKQYEEEINRLYISAYGFEKEIDSEVSDDKVSIRRAERQRDVRSFISYAVGCMFGRYSLDIPGLIYAGGEWDISKYNTFEVDEDAIIPICDDEYFNDDIVGRFVKFVEVVYGKETLEANLKFIADALGGNGTPREIIRGYFINSFYADHLKVYQKRPIYWLFDSGKKNGFKCLVYMHRYKPDTIARIRTDYVHEQQSRYRTAIADLQNRIDNAATTSERVKLSKKLKTVQEQDEELRIYEEKIHHLADQMIKIDLDDGVKVNYAKFQDVLAKIK